MNSLDSKIALVTGATRGIGKSIAVTLGKQGAYVIGTATTQAGAEAINDYFKSEQVKGHGIMLDVRDPQQIEAMMDALTTDNQLPSILVNNAGITADNLLLRMDDEEWLEVIETNLNAVYRVTKACIKPMFRARWGRVINIGSVIAACGNSGSCNYTAAKAGIIGFSKSLAQELGSRGVTINVVAPGFIDTDMTAALPDVIKDDMMKRIALRKFGQPEDIAATVAFLASDGAKYITGETIHVNGGMYMN